MDECEFGCKGDDVAVHNGWFHCTPESRKMLVKERKKLARRECWAKWRAIITFSSLPGDPDF